MLTRDHEFHRHVGYAMAFSAPSAWSKNITLFSRFSVLAMVIAVLGKSVSIAISLL